MTGEIINFLQERKIYIALCGGLVAACLSVYVISKVLMLLKIKEIKKANASVKSQELLEAFGEMRVHWWWPWSKKVKNITLDENYTERAKKYSSYRLWYRFILALFTPVLLHVYLIKWYELKACFELSYGGDMEKEFNSDEEDVEIFDNEDTEKQSNYDGIKDLGTQSCAGPLKRLNTTISDDTKMASKDSIEFVFKVKHDSIEQITLKEALSQFGLGFMLDRLDANLQAAQTRRITKKQHEEYFNDEVNKNFKDLSKKHHPDIVAKAGSSQEEMEKATKVQQGINTLWQVMKNMQEYSTLNNKYKGFRSGFTYSIYADVEVGVLANKQKLDQLNNKVLEKLSWLSSVRSNLRTCVSEILESRLSYAEQFALGVNSEDQFMLKLRTGVFLNLVNEYFKQYESFIVELAKLRQDCYTDKDLSYIKSSVDGLMKDCIFQRAILLSARDFFQKKDSASSANTNRPYCLEEKENYNKADEYFTLPVIECLNIIHICTELTAQLTKEKHKEQNQKQGFWGQLCCKIFGKPEDGISNGVPLGEEVLEDIKQIEGDEIQVLCGAESDGAQASYGSSKTSKDLILAQATRKQLHIICYYLISYGKNKNNLFRYLKNIFEVQEMISQEEAKDLAYELTMQYHDCLTKEFIPEKSYIDILADCFDTLDRIREKMARLDGGMVRLDEGMSELREGMGEFREVVVRIGEGLGELKEANKQLKETNDRLEETVERLGKKTKSIKKGIDERLRESNILLGEYENIESSIEPGSAFNELLLECQETINSIN